MPSRSPYSSSTTTMPYPSRSPNSFTATSSLTAAMTTRSRRPPVDATASVRSSPTSSPPSSSSKSVRSSPKSSPPSPSSKSPMESTKRSTSKESSSVDQLFKMIGNLDKSFEVVMAKPSAGIQFPTIPVDNKAHCRRCSNICFEA
ncbi:putative protein TPRXL isoform X2 [Vigna radiata var. radiata]|uniref:Uncharacterized protein n=1 Tax=Vigna radiata var. radiata TaxID=3916 RepID=A0A3Q0F5T1_VIGRR|nr:putative protein TPRXL isoform X2 [Vigna radiata var. radiata]